MKREKSKKIRDPIHNYIKLGKLETSLIDTTQFQRLRYIRQLGLNYLVYPGANHTRFEHSLGVYHLANACAEEIGFEEHEKEVLSVAALLHDIGHGPFSHLSEKIFEKFGSSHEDFTIDIMEKEPFATILEDSDISLKEVRAVLEKKHSYSSLISSQLDVDKMDYLVRDAHYTGVATGADLGRIVNTHRLVNGRVAITETSLPAVESLLISRFIMYPSVYNHPTARIAECMLLKAFELAHLTFQKKGEEVRAEELQQMKDLEFLLYLSKADERTKKIVENVLERKLLKTALEIPFEMIGKEQLNKVVKRKNEIAEEVERRLVSSFSLSEEEVIVDFPELPIREESPLYIVTKDGELKSVYQVSNLASILQRAQYDHWKIRVILPEKLRNVKKSKIKRIFEDFFEINKFEQTI